MHFIIFIAFVLDVTYFTLVSLLKNLCKGNVTIVTKAVSQYIKNGSLLTSESDVLSLACRSSIFVC